MTNPDDKHDDHELAAWLDGRDGVSAAYRQTAHEEPPPALDRKILQAARSAVEQGGASHKPAPPPVHAGRNAIRKPYALAASVMIAIAGLSLYLGVRDDLALQPGAASERVIELEAPVAPQPDAVSPQDSRAQDVAAEAERRVPADAQSPRAAADAGASDAARTAAGDFAQRQLAPAAPIAGAAATGAAVPPAAAQRREAFARREAAPVIVIDGPLLQQIEAEAEAAQAGRMNAEADEVTVTGSRVLRPDAERPAPAYRASRDEWLAALRTLVAEIERSTRLTVAQRNTAVLESQLEDEIALFLQAYPDTDIDAELGLSD